MVSKRQIHTQLAETLNAKADRARYQNAVLGHPDGTVYITERPGYVWARLGGANGQIIQLYARGLMAGYNMPVVIQRLPHRPQDYGIVDLDISAWPSQASGDNTGGWDGSAYVGKHANQHWYFGGDPMLVHLRAFTPLRVYAAGGMYIGVQPGIIPRAGVDLNIAGQVISLSDEIPLVSGQQRYSLITLDSNGLLAVTRGTVVTGLMGLSLANVPDTPAGHFRLAAVRCYYGQTSINESATSTDIIDLRWPQESIAGSPYALFGTQAANTVLAGPTTGAAAVPTFRALVAADLPAHDIVSAHSTSGRTAGQVLQATGATAFGWSTNTLSIAGNSTINGSLVGNMTGSGTVATGGFTGTIPATMTLAGRNVANTFTAVQTISAPTSTATTGALITSQTKTNPAAGSYSFNQFSGTIALSSNALGSQDFYGINVSLQTAANAIVYSNAQLRSLYLSVLHNGSGTIGIANGGFVDIYNTAAGTVTGMYGYSGFLRNIGAGSIGTAAMFFAADAINSGGGSITNQYGVYILNQTKASSLNAGIRIASQSGYALYCDGGPSYHAGNFGIGKAPSVALDILLNNSTTATVDTITTLTHNTTGTAAAGFGGSIALNLESSTTADQAAAALEWSWATATHASRKARVVGKVYDTAARTWLQVDTDGSTSDVLINSLIYGSMYMDDGAQAVTATLANAYYEVGGGMTGSLTNGTTFQNSKELLISVAGTYEVDWSIALSNNNSDQTIAAAVMVNSTEKHTTENATRAKENGVTYSLGGTGIIALAVNDVVKLCVENETAAGSTITVNHANLKIVRIGE